MIIYHFIIENLEKRKNLRNDKKRRRRKKDFIKTFQNSTNSASNRCKKSSKKGINTNNLQKNLNQTHIHSILEHPVPVYREVQESQGSFYTAVSGDIWKVDVCC